ncbi:hypothetical protein O6H91_Y505300 [Diphasiastrum complanatum]|nr:hypothetical protein O6H91_Y505300 [Diphasiastrum complanatum]
MREWEEQRRTEGWCGVWRKARMEQKGSGVGGEKLMTCIHVRVSGDNWESDRLNGMEATVAAEVMEASMVMDKVVDNGTEMEVVSPEETRMDTETVVDGT